MSETLRPAAGWELASMIAPYIERREPMEIVGSGSKRAIGRPMQTATTISTASMRGIYMYEPTELVMGAHAGTPIAQIEADLAGQGQMLAFEPIDLGPSTGGARNTQTIGAVFSSNVSGSRRISAGAARDHLLGVEGVNGAGELFRSGGRVMKNVTGYDLCRGVSGSWGTLACLTQLTFKVLPMADEAATLVYTGLTEDIGVELLCTAMQLPYEVTGAAHIPEAVARRIENETLRNLGASVTAIRIENFRPSVIYRSQRLIEQLKVYGDPVQLDFAETLDFWAELRRLSVMPYSQDTSLWRISTAPTKGPVIVAAIRKHMPADVYYDWSGGLVWVEVAASADAGASDIRRAVAVHGGHATLIRAEPSVRASVEVFQPQAAGVESIMRGLKHAFDPHGLFNPGRMYATI
ncbi:MAG: FAD-binding protein [Pseudomonadota bacterium]